MTISSPLWLLAMFGTVAFHWLLPQHLRQFFLFSVTAVVLLLVDYQALLLMLSFLVITYGLLRIDHRAARAAAIVVPLVALVFYKADLSGDSLSTVQGVAIPLGLSYTVFRILHYVIERSRNNLPEHRFTDYAVYVFFLPTLLVGPINRFPQFLRDFQAAHWSSEHISRGLERILIGYFKVVVIGNTLLSGLAQNWLANTVVGESPLYYYLQAVISSLNLYFQFAGYSDVAIGFALMLGYRVMENFRFPFLQSNISDFWRCWHISLTSWSREYVFMSALSITRQPYYAVMCSLLFIGIWHELSFRYVAWGAYHGLGIILYMQWTRFRRKHRLGKVSAPVAARLLQGLSIALTANFFFFGFILTGQDSVLKAMKIMLYVLAGAEF